MHYMHYIFLVLFTFIILRIHRHLLRMEKYRTMMMKSSAKCSRLSVPPSFFPVPPVIRLANIVTPI